MISITVMSFLLILGSKKDYKLYSITNSFFGHILYIFVLCIKHLFDMQVITPVPPYV